MQFTVDGGAAESNCEMLGMALVWQRSDRCSTRKNERYIFEKCYSSISMFRVGGCGELFEHFSKLNHGIGADIDIYTDCLNQLLSTLINESFLLVGHSTVGVLAGR